MSASAQYNLGQYGLRIKKTYYSGTLLISYMMQQLEQCREWFQKWKINQRQYILTSL